jgi:hypothetical protein
MTIEVKPVLKQTGEQLDLGQGHGSKILGHRFTPLKNLDGVNTTHVSSQNRLGNAGFYRLVEYGSKPSLGNSLWQIQLLSVTGLPLQSSHYDTSNEVTL